MPIRNREEESTNRDQSLDKGRGRGRQPGGFGLGPGNFCVCPHCGTKIPHKRGIPCYTEVCPKCGQPMARTQ